MDGLIASHCISSSHLRAGNFEAFFDDRVVRLLNLVEAAIGKPVRIQEAPTAEDPQAFPDETDGDVTGA